MIPQISEGSDSGGTYYPYPYPPSTTVVLNVPKPISTECLECIHKPVCKYVEARSGTDDWCSGCKHYYMDPKVMAEKL